MARFRKRPVVVEAFRWVSQRDPNQDPSWFKDALAAETAHVTAGELFINTLEGQMTADEGDWIIRGVKGELYPCKDDIFQETYDHCLPEDLNPLWYFDPDHTQAYEAAWRFGLPDQAWVIWVTLSAEWGVWHYTGRSDDLDVNVQGATGSVEDSMKAAYEAYISNTTAQETT